MERGWKDINCFFAGMSVSELVGMEPTIAEASAKRLRVFSDCEFRFNYRAFTKDIGEDASDGTIIPKIFSKR